MMHVKRLARCYREVFGSEAGKIVLADLSKNCHVMKSTYNGDGHTAFREGQRSVMLRILQIMEMNEHEIMKLEREYNEQEMFGATYE